MMCVLCVQRVSRQNLRVLKHMHIKRDIALRSPMPGGLAPLELIYVMKPVEYMKGENLTENRGKTWPHP